MKNRKNKSLVNKKLTTNNSNTDSLTSVNRIDRFEITWKKFRYGNAILEGNIRPFLDTGHISKR